MKLNSTHSVVAALLVVSSAKIQATPATEMPEAANPKVYFSVFGGGGASNNISVSQYGTAYFIEDLGGALAVNSFGNVAGENVGFVGGHIGYQWKNVSLNPITNHVSLAPAVELEGYHIAKRSFSGDEINNDTTRLSEHDFYVTYPISTDVFLANTVLNFNLANFSKWRPYVGVGIGSAVVSISNANSLQTSPLEADVNHYNSNPNDKTSTFATQTKVGLNFEINEHVSLFGEYRWLYIANTDFIFGSTNYTGHSATSSWNVNLGAQSYNLGSGGIRLTI